MQGGGSLTVSCLDCGNGGIIYTSVAAENRCSSLFAVRPLKDASGWFQFELMRDFDWKPPSSSSCRGGTTERCGVYPSVHGGTHIWTHCQDKFFLIPLGS